MVGKFRCNYHHIADIENVEKKHKLDGFYLTKMSLTNAKQSSYLGRSLHTLGLPLRLSCKGSACSAGDLSSIPGLGRSPGEVKGYPLQYSGLENAMDCIVQGVAKRHD